MKITIREMDESSSQSIKKYGSPFEVTSKLVLHAESGKIRYTVVDVPPYTKQYGAERVDPDTYIASSDRIVFLAYVDDKLAGQIRVYKNWNAFAYIDDIAVESDYRGQGIARASWNVPPNGRSRKDSPA